MIYLRNRSFTSHHCFVGRGDGPKVENETSALLCDTQRYLKPLGTMGGGGEGRRRQDQKRERFLSRGKRGDEDKDNKSDKSQRL